MAVEAIVKVKKEGTRKKPLKKVTISMNEIIVETVEPSKDSKSDEAGGHSKTRGNVTVPVGGPRKQKAKPAADAESSSDGAVDSDSEDSAETFSVGDDSADDAAIAGGDHQEAEI